ncbi:MAG: hypothetical protein JWN03_842 [Nocardia sp.]|uniref:RNaseH domain-containing protein n=1 Tax=Nocardia sp. TaxID=1821 RepID=UPI00262476DF|nr:RNaseH domain-containing protein [Nocardia sp.]MCU1640567.1 hypothetical protein [Nocardia sp.]
MATTAHLLYANGVGCRSLWPGLANRNLGLDEPDAHLGLVNADDHQIALVRVITNDDSELFQPVRPTFTTTSDRPAVGISTKLHKLLGARHDAYYLINQSRSDKAFNNQVRAGGSPKRASTSLTMTANSPRRGQH